MSFEVRILVNGKPCRQYIHDGKTYIEAKDSSEYAIEIKNNSYGRVLAVCSVDGINIIDGEAATHDGPGYVLNSLSSSKYDGFRKSDNKVAKFTFGKKETSYAALKENGSTENVGVIGVAIFSEKHDNLWINPIPNLIWPTPPPKPPYNPWMPIENPPPWKWGELIGNQKTVFGDTTGTYSSTTADNNILRSFGGSSLKFTSFNASYDDMSSLKDEGEFDMGTQWGNEKESNVIEVEFKRNVLIYSKDIFYASRKALIAMGVNLTEEKQIAFPSSFGQTKYAKPPPGKQ